jgi:hypothetical protein
MWPENQCDASGFHTASTYPASRVNAVAAADGSLQVDRWPTAAVDPALAKTIAGVRRTAGTLEVARSGWPFGSQRAPIVYSCPVFPQHSRSDWRHRTSRSLGTWRHHLSCKHDPWLAASFTTFS